MSFSPAPKPEAKAPKMKTYLSRSTTPLKRTAVKRGTKAIPKQNVKRIAKKAKAYRTVLASDFHKKLRYDAFVRSGGLCECEECVMIRRTQKVMGPFLGPFLMSKKVAHFGLERVYHAFDETPIWFTKKGGESWQRFRSTAGELHHTSYKCFGDENPDELRFVQWIWKSCHQRIEAEHGTRRRFLTLRGN